VRSGPGRRYDDRGRAFQCRPPPPVRELRERRTLDDSLGIVRHLVDSQPGRSVLGYANAGSQNRDPDDGELHTSTPRSSRKHFLECVPREPNQDADDASKLRDRGNDRKTFAWIESQCGRHDVDRFADGTFSGRLET